MPTATNRGVELRYERSGSGAAVVFVPTLGYGPWQWSWQFPAVAGPFEAIAPVLRGTPPSDAPAGPYDVATLADDLEAVLADAGVGRAHLVGFGLGGHVVLEHAASYDRARSLALLGTTPGDPDATPPADVVDGLFAPRDDRDALRSTLDPVLSTAFRARHEDVLDGVVDWRAEEDATRDGWEAQAPAFEDWERDWPPYEVTEPTLVLHGADDRIVPSTSAEALADQFPDVTVETFDDAGHLVTVERSRPVNDRLLGFLEEHSTDAHA